MKTNKTLTTAIESYLSNKKSLDLLESLVKESKKVIEDFLETSGELETLYATETGDLYALKLAEIARTDVNRKQLEEKYPEIFEAVKTESTYNRLTVKAKTKVQVELAKVA